MLIFGGDDAKKPEERGRLSMIDYVESWRVRDRKCEVDDNAG